jgi:hypothetical protein
LPRWRLYAAGLSMAVLQLLLAVLQLLLLDES